MTSARVGGGYDGDGGLFTSARVGGGYDGDGGLFTSARVGGGYDGDQGWVIRIRYSYSLYLNTGFVSIRIHIQILL